MLISKGLLLTLTEPVSSLTSEAREKFFSDFFIFLKKFRQHQQNSLSLSISAENLDAFRLNEDTSIHKVLIDLKIQGRLEIVNTFNAPQDRAGIEELVLNTESSLIDFFGEQKALDGETLPVLKDCVGLFVNDLEISNQLLEALAASNYAWLYFLGDGLPNFNLHIKEFSDFTVLSNSLGFSNYFTVVSALYNLDTIDLLQPYSSVIDALDNIEAKDISLIQLFKGIK